MNTENVKPVMVRLNESQRNGIRDLKEFYGFKNLTETIRFILTKEMRVIKEISDRNL